MLQRERLAVPHWLAVGRRVARLAAVGAGRPAADRRRPAVERAERARDGPQPKTAPRKLGGCGDGGGDGFSRQRMSAALRLHERR